MMSTNSNLYFTAQNELFSIQGEDHLLKSKTGFNKPRHYVDNRNTVCVYIYKNINMDSLESESDCMAHNLVLATDGDFFF